MREIHFDIERLKVAMNLGWYQSGRNYYGTANIPIDGRPGEYAAYDIMYDRRGNLSVNVRNTTRDTTKKRLIRLADFRGFIIDGQTGNARQLTHSKSNRQERNNPRKHENWRAYATFLRDWLEAMG